MRGVNARSGVAFFVGLSMWVDCRQSTTNGRLEGLGDTCSRAKMLDNELRGRGENGRRGFLYTILTMRRR